MKKLKILLALFVLCGCQSVPTEPDEVTDPVVKEETPPENQDVVVHFSGVGDNLIHDSIYRDADRLAGEMNDGLYDFLPMYEDVKDEIEKSDLAFINQETILGGDELGLSGYPTFNSPQCLAEQLPAFGFNMINHATNHALDKWETGVNNAISFWRQQSGIVMAGIYDSWEDRAEVRVIEKNGIRFSFLAYTYGTNGIESYAGYAIPYFDETAIREDVARAKEVSDVVIVSAHWGMRTNLNQMNLNMNMHSFLLIWASMLSSYPSACYSAGDMGNGCFR